MRWCACATAGRSTSARTRSSRFLARPSWSSGINSRPRDVTLDCWGCAKSFTYFYVGGSFRELCDDCREAHKAASDAKPRPRKRGHSPSGKAPTYNVAKYMVEVGLVSPSALDDDALRWLFRDLIETRTPEA